MLEAQAHFAKRVTRCDLQWACDYASLANPPLWFQLVDASSRFVD